MAASLRLDLCRECQFVWFDAREFEQLPVEAAAPMPEQAMPLEAREKLAMAEVKCHSEMDALQRQQDVGSESPEEPWKWIPAAFGFPVEMDVEPVRSVPWITWGLGAVLAIVFLLTFEDLDAAVKGWGLIPDQAFRHGGLTWLSSFFLHGSLLHLAGNVYFLWFSMPAYLWIAFWVLLQTAGGALQMEGISNVSSLAHLGGVAVGIAAWFAWRHR